MGDIEHSVMAASLLRSEKDDRKIENSVNEMKALIQKINIMLNSVGENVFLKGNSKKYDEVINQQEILAFCGEVRQKIKIRVGIGLLEAFK